MNDECEKMWTEMEVAWPWHYTEGTQKHH